MKKALILEGGAMQGMYTAGVLDVFMENSISFDGVIGVSAGALFGVNFLSGQNGRAIRYNKKYNSDKDYMGIIPLLKTGNIIDTKYAYEKVPHVLEPFDDEAFRASPVPFYAVVTNIDTGKPEYVRIKSVFEQMDDLRASGSMPFVSRPVSLRGEQYLDGAVTDSIPFQYMLDRGYDHLTVVLTKSAEYVKKPINPYLADSFYKKKYPAFANAVKNRHVMYNGQMEKLLELQKSGVVDVIRPSKPLYISKTEKDPEKMEKLYQLGRSDALKTMIQEATKTLF